MKNVTIKDVAAAVGMSVTTVSKALNNYRDVNPETRSLISKVAREMGYRPNPIASSLVKKESKIIGYVMASIRDHSGTSIFLEWLSGLFSSIAITEYEVMLLPVDTQLQREKSFAQFVHDYHLAGVILQGLRTDDRYYLEVASSSVPTVLIDMDTDQEGLGSVMTDNVAASADAVSYLISRGRRRVAHVSGTAEAWITADRIKGYRLAHERAGLEFDPSLIVDGEFLEDPAFRVTESLLRSRPDIDAIFCASDVMSTGVIRAARARGLVVPDDVAVVSFDDVEWARLVTPALTTIRQNFYEMGFEAARMLHLMISGRATGRKLYIPHELVIRESAG